MPHRHLVFSIPKILWRYFLYDRNLLSGLSRCTWEAVQSYPRLAGSANEVVAAAVNAIQTFGDFPGFNPHGHMQMADGRFHAGVGKMEPP